MALDAAVAWRGGGGGARGAQGQAGLAGAHAAARVGRGGGVGGRGGGWGGERRIIAGARKERDARHRRHPVEDGGVVGKRNPEAEGGVEVEGGTWRRGRQPALVRPAGTAPLAPTGGWGGGQRWRCAGPEEGETWPTPPFLSCLACWLAGWPPPRAPVGTAGSGHSLWIDHLGRGMCIANPPPSSPNMPSRRRATGSEAPARITRRARTRVGRAGCMSEGLALRLSTALRLSEAIWPGIGIGHRSSGRREERAACRRPATRRGSASRMRGRLAAREATRCWNGPREPAATRSSCGARAMSKEQGARRAPDDRLIGGQVTTTSTHAQSIRVGTSTHTHTAQLRRRPCAVQGCIEE